MSRWRRIVRRSSGGAAALALVGCLSGGPAAPAVRWLDPLGVEAAAASGMPEVGASTFGGVVSGPHLRQELLLRTAAGELRYDGDRMWLREPVETVALALERAGFVRDVGGPQLELVAFEIDVQQVPPVARVEVWLRREASSVVVVKIERPAADARDASLVQAMADALRRLPGQLAAVR